MPTERPRLEWDEPRRKDLQTLASKSGGLCSLLWTCADRPYDNAAYSELWRELTKLYGKSPADLRTDEEFWHPALVKALSALGGGAFVKEMQQLLHLRMRGQFCSSPYRRSFRSADFGYHAAEALRVVCNCLRNSTYKQSVEQALTCQHDWVAGYEYSLAVRLYRCEADMVAQFREAILGENGELILTRKMIQAIIISGHKELLDLLLKLLLAAKLQEGLRQAILESADMGGVETMTAILKLCLDQDLFRYSSTLRAFDTWAGLGYGDNAKPATIKKYAALAYDCLTDAAKRRELADSPNNLEAYLAIWATGCYEVKDTDTLARQLIDDPAKYRRALGWYFVSHVTNDRYRMNMAADHLEEREPELLAWVVMNLVATREVCGAYTYGRTEWKAPTAHPNDKLPAEKADRLRLFDRLAAVVKFIGAKNRTYEGNPFEFSVVQLNAGRAFDCLMSVAGYDLDPDLIEKVVALLPLADVSQRRAVYLNLLDPWHNADHRAHLRNALNDRSVQVKELAITILTHCQLLPEDIDALCGALRSKSTDVRKSVVKLLAGQDADARTRAAQTLLAAPEESQLQAGIELLLALKEETPGAVAAARPQLDALAQRKVTTQTQILLDQLADHPQQQNTDYTPENGFGLYDSAVLEQTVRALQAEADSVRPALLTEKQLKALLPPEKDVHRVLTAMNEVFTRHANYELEVARFDGSREKVLFGNEDALRFRLPIPAEYGVIGARSPKKLEMVPFHEEFVAAMGDYATDNQKLVWLYYALSNTNTLSSGGGYTTVYKDWYKPIVNKGLMPNYAPWGTSQFKNRYHRMVDIVTLVYENGDPNFVFEHAFQVSESMLALVDPALLGENAIEQRLYKGQPVRYATTERPIGCKMISFWRARAARNTTTPEQFRRWFVTAFSLQNKIGLNYSAIPSALTVRDYFRACDRGIIPRDTLYHALLNYKCAEASGVASALTVPTHPDVKYLRENFAWALEASETLVNRIVEVEEKRGEMPTPLTGIARYLHRFEGARHFCALLAALGKEKFYRGYDWGTGDGKQPVLSRLLKHCWPAKTDTPETLAALLKATDISDKRLAEAVVYAPQWAGFAEQVLGWPGLKKAVWFFHAHISERFSAEKETEVAIYSPITPQQFNDGAFDKDWFLDAVRTLGEKRFDLLYKSAKYITNGSNQHRRSQLYADAVQGRLNAEELRAEIAEKRNQEKLRAYPLIPLSGDKPAQTAELVDRYTFIQKFLKESRQFGAQRRASEGKACRTALENLAITAGLGSVDRLTWLLESEQVEALRPLMEPQPLDAATSVALTIDADGTADMTAVKNGKPLKTLPKAFNKHETVLALKQTVKDLREQKSRARLSLETAMVDGTEFGAEELGKIAGNPVLAPMLCALVWTDGSTLGFLQGQGGELALQPLTGDAVPLVSDHDATLRLAHPHDLRAAGQWAAYMRLLYERKLVQPFKQVFREYYPLTEDEKQERTVSRRYAGHQVQPQRTVALLRARGWTVDYEEGLQRIYYKQNLIVRLFALADWFSPADIEAPTLETVRFFDRDTGNCVPLEEVPPLLFSEVMRDIDLVVSVAHVGGVDPEASHSTVEMRVAIAKELFTLLKLPQVEFVGTHHAKIHGKLAEYSVHMGSGVVHAEGRGMIAILPVHSQARGRIFLPFADDDPKTAEILSKIILLAEDGKIKDPEILRQITG